MIPRQGWDVFEVDGRYEIQRVDDANVFESDEAALTYVAALASQGDEDAHAAFLQHGMTVGPAMNPNNAAHTPGKARFETNRVYTEAGQGYPHSWRTEYRVVLSNGADIDCFGREGDARLIADVFNVADESGLTPSQLVEQRAGLVAALRQCIDALRNVPVVGKRYDQQYSCTHLAAELTAIDALAKAGIA